MDFLSPYKVISHFNINKGMKVSELHAGAGHFTELLKEKVGEYGIVESFQHHDEIGILNNLDKSDIVFSINYPVLDDYYAVIFQKANCLLKEKSFLYFIDYRNKNYDRIMHFSSVEGFLRVKSFNAGDFHHGIVFKKI